MTIAARRPWWLTLVVRPRRSTLTVALWTPVPFYSFSQAEWGNDIRKLVAIVMTRDCLGAFYYNYVVHTYALIIMGHHIIII